MNTILNVYLEPMLYLGCWTQFTVYLVLSLSPSENVILDLMDFACSGLSHMYLYCLFLFCLSFFL